MLEYCGNILAGPRAERNKVENIRKTELSSPVPMFVREAEGPAIDGGARVRSISTAAAIETASEG